ncbi:SixA phosphatase family protein [Egicoccus halophilus]|uniref:Histidine phosphatase family protein n=1 Tax=Egicoccus halophilus TaxID=1670830 RepID=A0A8J3EZ05_9ACTN|nr:histidine phosphatase family protein [Egicoccus halophilus]GGI08895.1 hypothetical protein GCM10011354_31370 [Egicoccus halophilus]
MPLLLLRHVHAGDRRSWDGDDRRRPASERGRRQAVGIVEQYADLPVRRILTSPYTRCVESVEPLAAARGVEVERDDALAEGVPLDVVHRLFAQAGPDAVLCSHGDVIGMVVRDLHDRGVDVGGPDGLRWAKGSTWLLAGADPRRPASVRYLPPPQRP